jgi:NAD-dependent deacetylase sirtuin 1
LEKSEHIQMNSREEIVREARSKGLREFILGKKEAGADPKLLLETLKGEESGNAEDDYWPLLILYLKQNVMRRTKLQHVNSIDDVCHLLSSCSNILVLTGAGISVSCGIPDFRSDTGIYERLARDFGVTDPESIFDIHFFREDPEPFYSFVRDIYPGSFRPSPTHYFIRLLEMKGKLLRNYSQNVDTLEAKAGISKVINCHGEFA